MSNVERRGQRELVITACDKTISWETILLVSTWSFSSNARIIQPILCVCACECMSDSLCVCACVCVVTGAGTHSLAQARETFNH